MNELTKHQICQSFRGQFGMSMQIEEKKGDKAHYNIIIGDNFTATKQQMLFLMTHFGEVEVHEGYYSIQM